MSFSEDHQLSRNSDSIIQRLPVEILTMIFSYAVFPSVDNPFILSWVCRHWRSIMLQNPKFWTVIRYKFQAWTKNPDFVQEIFRRSKSCPLDVFSCKDSCRHLDGCPGCYVISESSRIKSLFVRDPSLFTDRSRLQCPKSFPQLENLIFHNTRSWTVDTMHRVLLASQPRFIQFSAAGSIFFRKEMSQNLSHVEWFKFHCDMASDLSLFPFFRVLQHLPGLKILNVSIAMLGAIYLSYNQDAVSMPVVTLPNLRMISLNLLSDQFHSIRTPPTLDYVGLSRFSREITHDWGFLNRIDLFMVKSFCVKLYDAEFRSTCYGNARSLIARIITMRDSDDDNNSDSQVFEKFHQKISSATLSSVESHLVLPPKNTFHIELHDSGNIDTALSKQLERAVNLVRLTLDYQSFKSDSDNKAVVSQLLNILDTVIHLKVVRCRSFSVICDILTKKRTVPRLERLTYHSSCKPTTGTTFVLKRLRIMKNARVKLGCEPLKILEMRNFVVLSPQQIEKIERMGIQFIQVSQSS